MSRAFFAQLFDAPAETVIAQGRVVLVAISLVGIWMDPTEPAALAPYVQYALIYYALYSLSVLFALHWRYVREIQGVFTHALDIFVVGALLFLTDGFSSPFLMFFTFVLLAASLRWDWQGIAATTAALAVLAMVVALIDFSTARQGFDLKETTIRVAYLIVAATILAYASAHREHERVRLAKLATWPASPPAKDRIGFLADTLEQSVLVFTAPRALVLWEDDSGKRSFGLWQNGACQVFQEPASSEAPVCAPELIHKSFSRTLPDLTTLNLMGGYAAFSGALAEDFVNRFQIGEFSSAPFRGITTKGRLFILGNIRRSDDHLLITSIVADRVGAELDRQIFLEEASNRAVAHERALIMRDLHDGLLQNLTAARAQLELLTIDDEPARVRIEVIRGLLRTEQLRIRQFVDELRAGDTEEVPLSLLRSFSDETAQFWGCEVTLNVEPATELVSRKTINQLSLLIAEAVANAVRHGHARHVTADVRYEDGKIRMEVKDDGQGFSRDAIVKDASPVEAADLPRSLQQRTTELHGQFQAWTGASGTRLQFEFRL